MIGQFDYQDVRENGIFEGVRRFSVSPRCSKMKYRHLLYACITKFDIMERSVRSKHVPLQLESYSTSSTTGPCAGVLWVETDEKRFMICKRQQVFPNHYIGTTSK